MKQLSKQAWRDMGEDRRGWGRATVKSITLCVRKDEKQEA